MARRRSMPWRSSSRAAPRASCSVRQRFATTNGATRTATTRVGHPSVATASATPAAVPPVPSGSTIASGGSSGRVCAASSRPASRWPTTARGWAPPPDLVAAAATGRAVLPFERQRPHARGPGERRRGRLQRRGPVAQPTGRERRAYLLGQSSRIHHPEPPISRTPMRVATDYIRHAARAARKCAGDPLGGAPQPPDSEFYKTLAKALEEIAAGLDQLSKEE